jgi:hypothetical protein
MALTVAVNADGRSASNIRGSTGGAASLEASRQPFGRDANDLFALDTELVCTNPVEFMAKK